MESTDIVVAAITAAGTLIGALAGSTLTLWLGVKVLRREHLIEYRSEDLVRRLLSDKRYRLRTFETIKYHLNGFADDELRQILIRSGAIRFTDNKGRELWGLLEKNLDFLEQEIGTSSN